MTKQELIPEEFNNIPGIKQIVKDLRMPTKIERAREEDFVMRSFLRHGNVAQIVTDLEKKHPDMKIKRTDVQEFILEYKDAIAYQNEMNKKNAINRIRKTREGLTHELLDLAVLSKNLAKKYDDEGDNQSAIAAIKAAADIFFRNAKIEGILDEKPQVNVNVAMDKLVLDAVKEEGTFAESVRRFVDKSNAIDAEFEEVDGDADED